MICVLEHRRLNLIQFFFVAQRLVDLIKKHMTHLFSPFSISLARWLKWRRLKRLPP